MQQNYRKQSSAHHSQTLKPKNNSKRNLHSNNQNQTKTNSNNQNQTKTNSNKQNQTKTNSNLQNQTRTNSNLQNQTKTNSNNQNQTKTKSNNQNQTKTNSNNQNQTKTNSNNQNQTRTKSNLQNQTKTNSNLQNQTKTNSNKQNQTKTNSNNQNQTKTKSNNQNQTKTNSNNQNQTKTNSNLQNQIQIQNENEKEFVVKYFPLDENTKIIQSENCYQMKDKDFDQLLILETLSAFQRMYEMPTYDYSIYAGKSQKEIPCHLFPLMARSPFIYTLYQENNERELFLPKFEPEIVELVIEFIYKGKIEFQLEQFDQFYLLANFLEMESLKIKIEKYVRARINTTNVANVYFKSRKIKSLFLFKYSKQFIQDNAQRFVTESDVDSINHNQIIEMAELIQLAPSSKSNNLILFFFDRWIKNFITKENVFSSDEIIDPIQILKEKRTVNDVIEIINEMNKNNKFDLDQDSQFNQNSLNIHSFSNLFNEKKT
ncbi:hypothetical protein M0811_12840 [Anaeramoeba ignava]|uniref:BTB domain-containing protein n=1 Tax=Anaeramoeba ignava TaxID=1746090 RepID=A0A9Q0L7H1_ANAIG|nr:hypothetical protein M0811_12840 [Anaeramoeba ignava]